MLVFYAGLVIGGTIGAIVMGILSGASDADDKM